MTSILFATLVFVMAVILLAGLARYGSQNVAGFAKLAVGMIAAYLLVPALLVLSGMMEQYEPLPRPMIPIILLVILTVYAALSPLGARLSTAIGLATLIGLQAFRFPLELLLHRMADENIIPEVMTYSGRNFDILTGVSAIILAVILMRRRLPNWLVFLWNVAGLLLLVNIVTIAVLATPVRFRVFTDGPPNLVPSQFPYVWLPTFFVQLALFGHLLVFRRLAAGRRPDRNFRRESRV